MAGFHLHRRQLYQSCANIFSSSYPIVASSVFSNQSKKIVLGIPQLVFPWICLPDIVFNNESCLKTWPIIFDRLNPIPTTFGTTIEQTFVLDFRYSFEYNAQINWDLWVFFVNPKTSKNAVFIPHFTEYLWNAYMKWLIGLYPSLVVKISTVLSDRRRASFLKKILLR